MMESLRGREWGSREERRSEWVQGKKNTKSVAVMATPFVFVMEERKRFGGTRLRPGGR